MKKIIKPRMYQAIAVKAALKALRSASKRALVVMATGLGKTITAAMIAKQFRAKRVLFLVHNNFILDHAMSEFRIVFGNTVRMSIYNGQSKEGAKTAQFVFATWQTMGEHLDKWAKKHFDFVIVDEAHHTEAETYAYTARYFNAPKLGITATPDRNDDEDIRRVFGKEVVNISLEEAIARGWLPKIEYNVITDESLDENVLQKIVKEIKHSKKRFTMAEVNRRLFIKKQAVEVAKAIESYGEKSIVFCESIAHADRMAIALSSAKAFHSGADKKNLTKNQIWLRNQQTLTELREGKIKQVTAVNSFNEGVDVPSIGLVAFCRQLGVVTTWRQQLGRGLRPGKDKLIVLDFVSNLERLKLLLETVKTVQDLEDKYVSKKSKVAKKMINKDEVSKEQLFDVLGMGFQFTFSQKIVDLIKVLEHCDREFYDTWQEASVAATTLGISNKPMYELEYKKDIRLPSQPSKVYPDFPGWPVFCGGVHKYETVAEASSAAKKLGITKRTDYRKNYKKDPKLPVAPDVFYSDFPVWREFLQLRNEDNCYATMLEAAKAAKKLGITSEKLYRERYEKDDRLPRNPRRAYQPDFTGWPVFLGKTIEEIYDTWQEASEAAIKLGITKQIEYRVEKKYKQDPRLPSMPENVYVNFPGWSVFLGGVKKVFYNTWQEASKSAIKKGIVSTTLYQRRYKEDPKLPSQPSKIYSDFPGWKKFFGQK